MNKPRIYADYNNTDSDGRLTLGCFGTVRDLKQYGIELEEGLALTFYMDDADDAGNPDDLLVDGIVSYDEATKCWVAAIDETTFRHASNEPIADNETKPVATGDL